MKKTQLILCTIAVFMILASANAQHASDWNMSNAHAINQSLQSLPLPEQRRITVQVGQPASVLRAMEVSTGAGNLVIVQGNGSELCNAAGNCTFWVLGADNQVLLKTVAQTFKFQPSLHEGKPDLLVSLQGVSDTKNLVRFQFSGESYGRAACAQLSYTDPDGSPYERPHVSAQPCPTL